MSLSCPPSLASRLVPLVKVLHAPLSLPKSTSPLDQPPYLSFFGFVTKDITPPSIQTSSMERPLTQVDIAFRMLGCEVQYERSGMWLEW